MFKKVMTAALSVVGLSSMLLLGVGSASAAYPDRAIKLVVPQAPGGGTDIIGRLWADYVSRRLNVPVVVENRPGANGVLASSYAAKQPADGYTVMISGVSYLAFNPHMYKDLPYQPTKDFTGIGLLVNTPFLLVASKQTGINTLEELVEHARANPESLNFASAGKGNSTHLVVEMLAQRYGMKLTHVPYNGAAPGLASVMADQTQLMADVLNTGAAQANAGNVTPLAVVGSKRAASVPNIPTLAELGLKDFPLPGWYALVAPSGTPPEAIATLNAETQKFFNDPEIKVRLQALQLEPLPSTPESVVEWTLRDGAAWGPLIRQLGLSND